MTVVVLLADPPRPGLRFPDLAATSPLSGSEAAELAAAMDRDAMRAVERSGADLLVNYRPDDSLDEAHRIDASPEAEMRALAADAVEDVSDVRFEPQVGSTQSARVGNTVTHLLKEEEEAGSVAVLPGNTPFVTRSGIDSSAMKLRSNEVVLGPGAGGAVYYAGFTDTVDFSDALTPPALNTLAELARGEGHDTEFLPTRPTVRTGDELASVVAEIRARVAADRVVPEFTTALIEEYGLVVDEDGLARR
ncbi:hypothetical protein B4589_004835 [Halolamina sp. CBA1230]|uniref:hypothetical protein n=1 Tax=Halolamina sp. CBA1230 TaxID=1853690 RepID=UPI0009A1E49C|nr:hypothetical protein [Halolamina sp. CBA1230]QKY19738.1 hypothetical protein B4589_004835 [Halolamina sp. CBA1230]